MSSTADYPPALQPDRRQKLQFVTEVLLAAFTARVREQDGQADAGDPLARQSEISGARVRNRSVRAVTRSRRTTG